jgi:hypothetical protein
MNDNVKEKSNKIIDRLTATVMAFIPTSIIKARRQKQKEESRESKREEVKTYKEARKEMKEILTWKNVREEGRSQDMTQQVETIEEKEDTDNTYTPLSGITDRINRDEDFDDDDDIENGGEQELIRPIRIKEEGQDKRLKNTNMRMEDSS